MKDRIVGTLVGLACGDAVGTTVEFAKRGSFKPVTDMVGGGVFELEKGQWTDDTSMALCLAHSLVHCQGFDPVDQMQRYCNWYQHGYMSSNGRCFDIGMTVSDALEKFLATGEAYSGSTDEYSSGNGALMRLAPIPMVYHRDMTACMQYAKDSSRTTHASKECIDASQLFAYLIVKAFTTNTKQAIFQNIEYEVSSPKLQVITDGRFIDYQYEQLTGSGYVVESLISALWCFYHADNFKEAVLLATNIGNDADTTAAICGQIAGAFYGLNGIPQNWRESISLSDDIHTLGEALFELGLR